MEAFILRALATYFLTKPFDLGIEALRNFFADVGKVAAHARSYIKGGYTTLKEHMPLRHRAYAEWSAERFIQWAGKTGEATAHLVEKILAGRTYQEQAFRSCMGIIQLCRLSSELTAFHTFFSS